MEQMITLAFISLGVAGLGIVTAYVVVGQAVKSILLHSRQGTVTEKPSA